jgi:hypothetical protein
MTLSLRSAAFAFLLAAAVPAQGAPEVPTPQRFFGTGCGALDETTPAIGHQSMSLTGNGDFAVTVSQAVPDAMCVLMLGVSEAPSPLPLGGACSLLIDGVFQLYARTANDAGFARVPLPVPNDPELIGSSGVMQWAVLDPGANRALGLAWLSNGMEIFIMDSGPFGGG